MSVNHPHHHTLEHTQQDEASIKTEKEREKEDAEGEDVPMTTSLEGKCFSLPLHHLNGIDDRPKCSWTVPDATSSYR
jgi:hypothetical protein